MMERFKRRNAEEPRSTGAVATSTETERETRAGEEQQLRDGTTGDDHTLAAGRTATTDDDRTMVADREAAPTTDDHRTMARDREAAPTADGDRTMARDREVADDDRTVGRRPMGERGRDGVATRAALDTARARQRDEFGGINWGAAFFGWLVAIGVAAILVAILTAAGAAVGLYDSSGSSAPNSPDEISLGGGIALIAVLMVAYFAGGYVAGRMSRFDGGRQGLGTWAVGLIVAVLFAAAALIFGDDYNVLEQLNLPSLPVGDSDLATGGIVAIVAIVIGSIIAAMAGGKMGERYHRKVDRAGFVD